MAEPAGARGPHRKTGRTPRLEEWGAGVPHRELGAVSVQLQKGGGGPQKQGHRLKQSPSTQES